MSSIVQCINSAFAACASNWSVRSPPHISLLRAVSPSIVGEVKVNCHAFWTRVSSTNWRILDWNALKKKKKFSPVCHHVEVKKLVFSTSQEETFDILLRLNRSILILYYQFGRDCCFVLNELNICKAITIIIINNVWTLFRSSGIDTLHV